MITKTSRPYVPGTDTIPANINEVTAKIHDQRAASRACPFQPGDRVRVIDYREDVANYNAVVLDARRNFFGDAECLVRTDDGRELWRGTASLRKAKRPTR